MTAISLASGTAKVADSKSSTAAVLVAAYFKSVGVLCADGSALRARARARHDSASKLGAGDQEAGQSEPSNVAVS